MLSESAREDPRQALFQLAHEVIHLLAPTGTKGLAPVLEEGLATFFSFVVSQRYDLGVFPIDPRYLGANSLARRLLDPHPDAIRRLREKQPTFHLFTAELIRSMFSGLDEYVAAELCKPFKSFTA